MKRDNILLATLVILLAVLSVSLFLIIQEKKAGTKALPKEALPEVAKVAVGEETVQSCLEKDELSRECRAILDKADEYGQCNGLADADECYYKMALSKLDYYICHNMEDGGLALECEMEVHSLAGPPYIES